jgi:hypothetical protein
VVARKPQPWRVRQIQVALGACALLVIAVGAFIAYRKFFAAPRPPPPKPAVVSKPAPPPVKPATPAAVPAATKPPASKRPVVSAPPAAPAAETAVAPPAARPVPPGPSPRFRAFVDQLKIGGFRVGPPARLFVGGIMYKEEDVIDQDLGVVFIGVDPKTEEVIFKDRAGVTLRRKF